jgi:hypothetical protein
MLNFVTEFAEGEMPRQFFDLDYSWYCIEHFPAMELESKKLARKFADTLDVAYELGSERNLSDKAFRKAMKNALRDFHEPYLTDL